MEIKLAALKFGFQLIEAKLGQIVNPTFGAGAPIDPSMQTAELPTTSKQKREQSAKIHPPRVITTR